MAIIDMRAMRYINLLDKITRVRTRRCFVYNNTLFFAVSPGQISRAIGPGAINIRKIQEKVGKRIKIIKEADGTKDCKRFIEDIIAPVRFKSLEIKDGFVIATAGNKQSKAAMIGREKRRYLEMKKIIRDVFNLDLKIL